MCGSNVDGSQGASCDAPLSFPRDEENHEYQRARVEPPFSLSDGTESDDNGGAEIIASQLSEDAQHITEPTAQQSVPSGGSAAENQEEKYIHNRVCRYFQELGEACKFNEASSKTKKRSYTCKKRKHPDQKPRLPRSAGLTRLQNECIEGILDDLKVHT